jgi:hypothetical protein
VTYIVRPSGEKRAPIAPAASGSLPMTLTSADLNPGGVPGVGDDLLDDAPLHVVDTRHATAPHRPDDGDEGGMHLARPCVPSASGGSDTGGVR